MTQPSAAEAVYRGMDRATLDAAYNNGAAVKDRDEFIARWQAASAAVRSGPQTRLDIPHGGRPRERFDYFATGRARPPLFVFFLIGVVVIVGALTFIPALALGPVVEHLALYGAK